MANATTAITAIKRSNVHLAGCGDWLRSRRGANQSLEGQRAQSNDLMDKTGFVKAFAHLRVRGVTSLLLVASRSRGSALCAFQ